MEGVVRVDEAYTKDFLGGSRRVVDEMVLRYLCCWLRAELYKRGDAFLGVVQEPPDYMKELT